MKFWILNFGFWIEEKRSFATSYLHSSFIIHHSSFIIHLPSSIQNSKFKIPGIPAGPPMRIGGPAIFQWARGRKHSVLPFKILFPRLPMFMGIADHAPSPMISPERNGLTPQLFSERHKIAAHQDRGQRIGVTVWSFPVSCLLSPVSCLLSPVSCLL
ncbi:MAG: hypothetical protein WCP35_20120, partial [Verrucomicrobiota bacterium]